MLTLFTSTPKGRVQQSILEETFGPLKQQLRPGQTVGEQELMNALGEEHGCGCGLIGSLYNLIGWPYSLIVSLAVQPYSHVLNNLQNNGRSRQGTTAVILPT